MSANAAQRLAVLSDVTGAAARPTYVPEAHGCGIVHLGAGAFHRAHQAVYMDDALGAAGGDWRIVAASLRGTDVVDALAPQNGLYTLVERGPGGTSGRVIASIAKVIAASRDRGALLTAMAAPETRIVSMTVTEKAYGIDRATMTADPTHPAVAADLQDPRNPVGVLGLLVESLRLRRDGGIPAFTVLCCDNLPDNGALVQAGVIDFARRVDQDLAEWIAGEVAFPSCMVDRITPASTQETFDDARRLTGCCDLGAVETEPFRQWVIEDRFPAGRPQWEAGGALFVDSVEPYELMKLRMLNGAHSMLAYAGFLSGCTFVRDVMADTGLRRLVDRHMRAAAKTLPRLADIDLDVYRRQLLERFANSAIAHETYQIAMDGTEKIPQRLLLPAIGALDAGGDVRPFAFAVAAWMRYSLGTDLHGRTYALRDPREDEIAAALKVANTADEINSALRGLPGLFDDRLASNGTWREEVRDALADMLEYGMAGAIAREASRVDDDR